MSQEYDPEWDPEYQLKKYCEWVSGCQEELLSSDPFSRQEIERVSKESRSEFTKGIAKAGGSKDVYQQATKATAEGLGRYHEWGNKRDRSDDSLKATAASESLAGSLFGWLGVLFGGDGQTERDERIVKTARDAAQSIHNYSSSQDGGVDRAFRTFTSAEPDRIETREQGFFEWLDQSADWLLKPDEDD
jgi:hypothetical protein